MFYYQDELSDIFTIGIIGFLSIQSIQFRIKHSKNLQV